MVVTMLNRGSKHLSLSLSVEDHKCNGGLRGEGFSLSPSHPSPIGTVVFFLFIICLNPEFLHITTCKGVFYQSLDPPPFQVCPDLPL